jgi:hypothetical protein
MIEPSAMSLPLWLADDLPPADRTAVTRRMTALIRQWEAAADRRAIFLSCYSMMTRNMLGAIHAGDFHDPAWVHNLLARFADYYFGALECAERGCQPAPAPWQVAFDAARDPDVHVVQHLLLGINAHINYDLVLCLDDVLREEWPRLSEQARLARYQDHCHVNDIIAATLDAVQDQVVERYAPWMDAVDRVLGRADEWLVTRLITHWRDEVWQKAVRRVELPDAAAMEAQRLALENAVVAHSRIMRFDGFGALFGRLGA